MVTADDEYYEQLRVAHTLCQRYEDYVQGKISMNVYEIDGVKLAQALLDVEERRQLALGELGESLMKLEGEIKDQYTLRAQDILAGRVEV